MADDNKRLNLRGLDYFYRQIQLQNKILYNTTSYWDSHASLIPPEGTIVVYSDKRTIIDPVTGNVTYEPDIKVCDGLAYLIDQPFINEDLRKIVSEHLANAEVHIQTGERAFWNHKVDVDDSYEVIHDTLQNETLVLTRGPVTYS